MTKGTTLVQLMQGRVVTVERRDEALRRLHVFRADKSVQVLARERTLEQEQEIEPDNI